MSSSSSRTPQAPWFYGPAPTNSPPADYVEDLRSRLGLMTAEQLALLLSVSGTTLKLWRSEGHGPDFTRLGKRVFYRESDVEKWIKSQVCVPGTVLAQAVDDD